MASMWRLASTGTTLRCPLPRDVYSGGKRPQSAPSVYAYVASRFTRGRSLVRSQVRPSSSSARFVSSATRMKTATRARDWYDGDAILPRAPRRSRPRAEPQRPAPHEDPPNYPIADVIASQNTVKSPKNWCGPCTITCSLRKFPAESNVTTNEKNPTSSTKVLLWEV